MKYGVTLTLVVIAFALEVGGARADWSKVDNLSKQIILEAIDDLREPRLHEVKWDKSAEVFRIIAMPALRPPLSVRVTTWPSGSAAATIRTLRYRGDLKRELALERAVVVSPDEMRQLRGAISNANFWELTTPWYIQGSNGIDAMPVCADSTLVAIEAVSGGRYHMVLRSCGRKEALGEIVEAFKRIAKPYLPKDVDRYVP